jgi:hypothetical protein
MGKTNLLLVALLMIGIVSCNNNSTQNDNIKGEEVTEVAGMYGGELSDGVTYDVRMLYKKVNESGEFEGQILGVIKEVCSKKGCWMTMHLPDNKEMRITFKDYGFFVPKNAQNYPVIIEGIASKKLIDVETLRHYAEDAGSSVEEIENIVGPKEEYEFVATAVKILEKS